ncbi:MAG: carbamate kinase [Hyphomicrobiales bacterium]|nr:carbamate kinase [Hyphomicrobiales bacterium]
MRIVFALGGSALGRGGTAVHPANQHHNIRIVAESLAPVCQAGHDVVITHGNGPQVGLLALQAAATPDTPYPLDVLNAQSAGTIGYLIEQHLMNVLPGGALIAALLTQVRVDPDDPAFRRPAKPVGPFYAENEARLLAAERGWRVAQDGKGWRRVVASPAPLEILEARVIEMLVDRQVVVICTGGGIPVVELEDGSLSGIEAVVDKDSASSLLARQLGADWLVMLTDVDALYLDWGTGSARALRHATPGELAGHRFAAGSIAPKVLAGCDFVNETGRRAGIGTLRDASAIIEGLAGTVIAVNPEKPDGQARRQARMMFRPQPPR